MGTLAGCHPLHHQNSRQGEGFSNAYYTEFPINRHEQLAVENNRDEKLALNDHTVTNIYLGGHQRDKN
jgi:hypothetical protein